MRNNKALITLCVILLFIGCCFTMKVYAETPEFLDQKVDVTIGEPIVITEGVDFTYKDLVETLYYGNLNLLERNCINLIKVQFSDRVIEITRAELRANTPFPSRYNLTMGQ